MNNYTIYNKKNLSYLQSVNNKVEKWTKNEKEALHFNDHHSALEFALSNVKDFDSINIIIRII